MNRSAVSVIVPSYNGQDLLKSNLPKVIKQLNEFDELIVVDDNSSDNTVEELSNLYDLRFEAECGDKYGKFSLFLATLDSGSRISLIVNRTNLRFAASCNRAVDLAKNQLVFLMNSDVEVTQNTISSLASKFDQNNSNKLFAVGCLETEPNEGNIAGGKNKLWFERGLFHHQRADDFKSEDTGWVSGGSGMFDREKWMKLGGFDVGYYPAYWEDIDLSQRAKNKGWRVAFCSDSKVIHNHQTTNKNVFDQNQLQQISWDHADKFSWKHSNLGQKVEYLLFRPYWWWQRWKQSSSKGYRLSLVLILLLALILRFYKLAQVPAGMTWDEAAIGYNGYAVIQTRRDEWLERLPISFRSFGDYKAPLAIYLVGLFVSLIDLNLWVLRLPFAIGGVLAVWWMIQLSKQLLTIHLSSVKSDRKFWIESLSLMSGLFLAVSPWHLHFTRTGFESGLALALIIWGVFKILKYFQTVTHPVFLTRIKPLFIGVMLLVASMYSYHSPKLFVPLISLTLIMVHLRLIKKRVVDLITVSFFAVLLLLPMILDSISGEGLTRAGSLTVLKTGGLVESMGQVFSGFVAHLSPAFLIGGWTDTLRHGATKYSVFLVFVFILIMIGLLGLIWNSIREKEISSWLKLSVTWIVLGLLPAVLGDSFPQANRALLALPGFIWLAIVGWKYLIIWFESGVKSIKLKRQYIIFLLLITLGLNLVLYLKHYYQEFAVESADAFNEGYIEAMEIAHQYEKGTHNKPEVNKIIISNEYGQAYIYALFVRKTNPIWYQGGSLNRYLFVDKISVDDFNQPNTLIIDTRDMLINQYEPVYTIATQDGISRFFIYYTGEM